MALTPDSIADDVRRALAEDIGSGDVSAQLIPLTAQARATVICREPAIICGRPWFDAVFVNIDNAVSIDWLIEEGQDVTAGQTLCRLAGPARSLLTGERTALNFLQTLSATATQARRYVDAIASTQAVVLDTRKTLPGLRQAQKYATQCGGCHNHRMGLYDAILIKENHIQAAGSIAAVLQQAQRQNAGKIPIEIEVEDLEQLQTALAAGAMRVLLDNFSVTDLRQAVTINQGQAVLEASGGVTLKGIRAIAETGVDAISVGDITKSIQAIDLSMRFSTANSL